MKLRFFLLHRKGRGLTYLRDGYGYVALFVSLVTVSGVVWSNVKDIPLILNIFQKYYIFTASVTLVIVPLLILLGWWHYNRKGSAFREQVIVQTTSNPYNNDLLTEKEKKYLPLLYLIAKELGIDKKHLSGFESILRSNKVEID